MSKMTTILGTINCRLDIAEEMISRPENIALRNHPNATE